jgi:hypothetical protein
MLRTYKLEDRRLIVVSRGGAGHWYRHLTSEYVDVFSLFTLDEYRHANEARWSKAGHQKQYRVEHMDVDIFERAKQKAGVQQAELLHPSLMYRILRFYWFEKAGIGLLNHHTDYRRLPPVARSPALKDLPSDYVAVRFYFRPSFPDTPENQRFAAHVIRSLRPGDPGGSAEYRTEARRSRRLERAREERVPRRRADAPRAEPRDSDGDQSATRERSSERTVGSPTSDRSTASRRSRSIRRKTS